MYANSSGQLISAKAFTAGVKRFQAKMQRRIIRRIRGSKRKIDFSGAKRAPKKPTCQGVSKG
jgi:hypothetical protein